MTKETMMRCNSGRGVELNTRGLLGGGLGVVVKQNIRNISRICVKSTITRIWRIGILWHQHPNKWYSEVDNKNIHTTIVVSR